MLMLMLYVFIGTPWVIAFEEVEIGSTLFYIELSMDCLFFLDMLVTFNSTYMEGNIEVTSRAKIAVHYLRGYFFIDLLAIFPFYLFQGVDGKSNSLIRIIRVTKLARVFRASKVLKMVKHLVNLQWVEKCIATFKNYEGAARMLSGGLIILIMSHFAACMWYFTAKLDDFGPDTWVVRADLQNESSGYLYLVSVYWAFTVLTTVGFGDFHARTENEMVLCIVWELFGIGFYTFLIGSLTSMLSSIDAKHIQLQENLTDIEQFSREYKLGPEWISKMRAEVKQHELEERMDETKKLQTLKLLSKELRHDVCLLMNNNAANRISFIRKQDTVFITEVIPRLKHMKLPKNRAVYKKRNHPDGVYFVVEGRVNCLLGQENIPFKSILKGGYFGEIELIERTLRRFSVATETDTTFLFMGAFLFKEVMEEYSEVATQIRTNAQVKKEKDKEAMSQLVDVLEMVEIKQKVVEEVAGTVAIAKRTHFKGRASASSLNTMEQISMITSTVDEQTECYYKLKEQVEDMKTLLSDLLK